MTDLPRNVDASSLVVSYLWTHGGQEIAASLPLALHHLPPGEVVHAVHDLQDRGWVDLLHDELPAVRLTAEARAALQLHVMRKTPLPERLERATDREARMREAAAMSQVELVQLIREQRDEMRQMREEHRQLAGGAPRPRALETRVTRRCGCPAGPLGNGRFCGECGGVA